MSTLHLQDPHWDESEYLLEALLEASDGSVGGAGAYAFASAGGIRLLFKDAMFQRFLLRSRFEVIVGMDAITDTNAIQALTSFSREFPNLTCQAFVRNEANFTFHPKISWFRRSRGATALTGSGNMTASGLHGNCEAFSIAELSRTELLAWEAKWQRWKLTNASNLLALDDPKVLQRGIRNRNVRRPPAEDTDESIIESTDNDLKVGRSVDAGSNVLIAEIPRGGSRWQQGNFDLETFTSFFGATPGKTQRILLTHVKMDGTTGTLEERASISSRSQNYRFELDAARGLAYPSAGRPIVLFVRVATRMFRYRLFMPGQPGYQRVSGTLSEHAGPSATWMRRSRLTWQQIKDLGFARRLFT
jgi:hypothetical protein